MGCFCWGYNSPTDPITFDPNTTLPACGCHATKTNKEAAKGPISRKGSRTAWPRAKLRCSEKGCSEKLRKTSEKKTGDPMNELKYISCLLYLVWTIFWWCPVSPVSSLLSLSVPIHCYMSYMLLSSSVLTISTYQGSTPLKTNMSPENQWLEDVYISY